MSPFVEGWIRGTFVGAASLCVAIITRTILIMFNFDPDAATLVMIGIFGVLVLAGAPDKW